MSKAKRIAKIGFPMQFPRTISPRMAADLAKALEASGVVDDIMTFDYLVSIIPRALWTPDVTPAAKSIPDDDSYHDAFILGAIALTASNLGLCILTDSMRRGPWLLQTMLSLAGETTGQVTLALGAGEARHAAPFGYARNEGLGRLKDMMKMWNLLLECDGPIDFEGKYWKLSQTYLGAVRPSKPKIWAMGGGPKLIEASTRDADGFVTYTPGVWSSPEQAAEAIHKIKQMVASHGRDPEAFEIGLTVGVIIHDDPKQIERTMQNKLVRFFGAIFGRNIQDEWLKEGIEPPFPRGYHYADKLFPVSISRAECDDVLSRMTDAMVRDAFLIGTPAEVAAQLQAYVDAGVTWVSPFDIGGFTEQDPAALMSRMLKVCGILKGKTPIPA